MLNVNFHTLVFQIHIVACNIAILLSEDVLCLGLATVHTMPTSRMGDESSSSNRDGGDGELGQDGVTTLSRWLLHDDIEGYRGQE